MYLVQLVCLRYYDVYLYQFCCCLIYAFLVIPSSFLCVFFWWCFAWCCKNVNYEADIRRLIIGLPKVAILALKKLTVFVPKMVCNQTQQCPIRKMVIEIQMAANIHDFLIVTRAFCVSSHFTGYYVLSHAKNTPFLKHK